MRAHLKVRGMTPEEQRVHDGINQLIHSIPFPEAVGVLTNTLVIACVHMNLPRSVFEACCLKTWDAIAEFHLSKVEGQA